MNITHLAVTWSVSRGRDTFGYNICRLDDRNTGKRFKCNGGGYDMIGTVFGEWLADMYQDRLLDIADQANFFVSSAMRAPTSHPQTALYGMHYYSDEKRTHLDGACGIGSMILIAEAIGLEVQREHNRKGHTVGYFVAEKLPTSTRNQEDSQGL